ncbi:MerR family transcriptional regulator [Fulvivirga lutea]|uniref:MerR family transcriptional regulator n=1 Tax=Fulvivirga lutea TaxID=2810512 RepID=A0A974WED5_9BACT|nr:MerR family transcriptional regulator [Fulvivirga lutea]QSE96049.1 MerR family transcriptional regulator [Fulvivirga lutea]
MGKYSIKELEALTGIKAHTIRIWEKRHNLIQPQRTSTNIRLYSDEDLKQILNVSILYNQGYKISKIANLSQPELLDKVTELTNEQQPEHELFIDQFTISMVEMDESKFHRMLSQAIIKFGFENTMNDIIYPFLRKIGILWLSNNINPAQEHFISNLIRQKIIVAIDGLDHDHTEKNQTALLFLPENEMHEIGLLFFHYLVKKKGYKTYYLGQNVPLPDLKKSVEKVKADILISAISYVGDEKELEKYLAVLHETFSDKKILIAGKPLIDRKNILPESIQTFRNPEELNSLL